MNKKYLLKIKKRLLLYSIVTMVGITLSECGTETTNNDDKQKVLRKEENYEK